MVRFMNLSGSPIDQRMRKMSLWAAGPPSRWRRWALSRSISSTDRSPTVRSSRPIALSLAAKPSTAAADTRRPSSASAAATSAAVRMPSNRWMTLTSTGRNRKYFRDFGSFTM